MNAKLFKHIFSKRLNTLVVVGENCTADGKQAGASPSVGVESNFSDKNVNVYQRFLGLLSLGFVCVNTVFADPASDALPINGVVAQGAASIAQQANQMTINQTTDKAVINWQGFDIGSASTVNVIQPSSQSVLLNRVVGNNPSQIFGSLNANGHVILVNPNGIVFGADGSVTASAFTASTLGISDADFMAGNFHFVADGSNGTILNQGAINTKGGYVALLGATVTNDGKITTNQGNVYMAAAKAITVPVTRSGRIKMELDPASINAAVNNTQKGLIVTSGGQVLMQAAALNDAIAKGSVINAGQINTVGAKGGDVNLLTDGGVIRVSGNIEASSTEAGKAGGQIIIGRDLETGVLAASTDASGAVLKTKDGFIETSGDFLKTDDISITAKDWLLDPANIRISTDANSNVDVTNPSNIAPTDGSATSIVNVSTIQNAINAGTNVTITTTNTGTAETSDGNITIANALTFNNTGSTDATFKLIADNGIFVNAGITATGSKLVNIDMLAKGMPGGVSIADGSSDNRSNGISVGNVAINTNGSLKMDGSSFNGLDSRRGIDFASGARIIAASFNIHGKSYTAASGNHGVKINSLTSFTATSSSVTSVINGISLSRITGITAGTDITGTNIKFDALNGSTIVIKGSNANTGLGVRISAAGESTDITTNGNLVFGALENNSSFSMRFGTITAPTGSLTFLGQSVGTGVSFNDSAFVNAGNTSNVVNVSITGNAVTATAGQVGYGINFARLPNAPKLTATGNIFIEGTVTGAGRGNGIIFSESGWGSQAVQMNAGGSITIRGNNRASGTAINTDSALNIIAGLQAKAVGNITLQAETNNASSNAIYMFSRTGVRPDNGQTQPLAGNVSLQSVNTTGSASGNILVQTNQGGILINNSAVAVSATQGTETKFVGKNITIDNTGGSIDVLSGAITAGSGKATGSGRAGIHLADSRDITATGNLNIAGASTGGVGINTNVVLTAGSDVNLIGTSTGTNANEPGVMLTGKLKSIGGAVNIIGSSTASNGGAGAIIQNTVDAKNNITLDGHSGNTNNVQGLVILDAVTSLDGAITVTGETKAANQRAVAITNNGGPNGSLTVKDGQVININANTLFINTASSVNAGSGTVFIRSSSPGNEILLGGTSANDVMSTTLSSQKLGIDNTELNTITAGNVVIGDTASAGLIAVSASATTLAQTGNITLQTGGNIAVNANLTIADAKQLTLDAAGANSNVTQSAAIQTTGLRLLGSAVDYSLTNTSNAIGTLAANAKSVSLYSSNALTVGSVAGTSGITSDNGIVSLSSAQAIGGPGEITSGTGVITFNTASGTGNYSGVITSTGSFTKAGAGTIVLSTDHVRTGDTFITGGTLQVGDGGTTGNLGTGSVSLSNGATLVIDRSDSINLSNSIGGQGNLYAKSSGGSLTLSNLSINKAAADGSDGNASFLAAGDVSINNSGIIRLSAQSTANNGNINITNTGGTLSVDSVNGVGGVSAHGSGNIALTGSTNSGYGLYLFGNVTALGGNIDITGSSSASTSGLTTPDAGVRSAGVVSAKNINLVANATNTSGAVLGFYGAEGSLIASEQLTLSGSSANSGNGFYNIAGTMTAGTGITVTGTSANGQGVGFDANVRLTNTAGDVVITGTANDASKQAIGLRGSRITNSNGVTRLVAAKGNLVSNSVNGAGGNWGVEPVGQPLLNIITHSGTGAVEVTAGTLAADAGAIDGKALTINQGGNDGVLVQTSGTGNVTAPKIANTGNGDVVVAAGASLAAGDATGGQVLTQSGNSISSGGKTYIYSGSVAGTGNLSEVDSSFSNLALAGSGLTTNAQLNSAFGATIAGGANTQVLFRQSALPNAFDLSLGNISKEYGSADLTGSALISALSAAYTANSGASTLTKVTGNNTFAMLASTAFDGLNVSAATRTAGENVNGGTPYAYSGMTNNNAIVAVAQPGLVITPKALSITANTISGTYSGATYDALATTVGFTSAGLVNATINGVAINDSISAVESTFKTGTDIGSGTAITASGSAQAGDFNRTIANASGTGLENYTISYTGNTGSIAKANATVTGNSLSTTYTGLAQSVTGFTVSGLVNNETAAVLTGVTATGATGTDAGTYTNTVSHGTATNYNLSFTNGALTIAKAPITIALDNKTTTYGSITPLTFSVSGLVNSETATTAGIFISAPTTTGYITASTTNNVGNYAITTATNPSDVNYANYTLTGVTNGNLNITPATLTFTVQDASKLVTKADPTLSYSVSGLVNGDTASAYTGPSISRVSGETAVKYAISLAGGSASNYNIVRNNGIFSIIGADKLLITMAPTATTYGTLGASLVTKAEYAKMDANNSLVTFFNLTNIGNNVWSDGVGGSITITPTLTGVSVNSNVGTYANAVTNSNTGTTASSGNFISVVTQAGNYVVNPAALTISASNITRTYDGSTFSVGSATATGFMNGEGFATLGGLSFTGDAIDRRDAGTYSYIVTANGNPNGNYAITYQGPAQLLIEPKQLTVSNSVAANKVIDGNTNAIVTVGSLNGLVGNETLGVTATGEFNDASAGTNKPVRTTYTLVDGENGGRASNYKIFVEFLRASIFGRSNPVTGGGNANNRPFVNPVIPTPIVPIDVAPEQQVVSTTVTSSSASTTSTTANAVDVKLANSEKPLAPEQCSAEIHSERCDCQKTLFEDVMLCKVSQEGAGQASHSSKKAKAHSNIN